MIIEPKVRGFICTASHPVGCQQSVQEQIGYVTQKGASEGPKNVLVIGASTGYGLASRIVATFGFGAKTIGVFFEKPASGKRTASAGWYNSAAFETIAQEAGYYAKSINGDAFSNEVKQQVIDLIHENMGKIDLIVYSLAAPRRIHPNTSKNYISTLKPIGQTYTNKTVDPLKGEIKEITLTPASDEEITDTIAVMGGEDWAMWIDALEQANCLADHATTVAYSYLGPELTHPIYKNGTIGRAKEHLQKTAVELNERLNPKGGRALISINKALVTQASAAIPVVPLYIALLFKVMKQKGTHEGCIEQMYRLFKERLYSNEPLLLDNAGRIRIDDLEMQEDVQHEVATLWDTVTTNNLETITDIQGYRDEFYHLFGFNIANVDYTADVDPEVKIPSIADAAVEG